MKNSALKITDAEKRLLYRRHGLVLIDNNMKCLSHTDSVSFCLLVV